MSVFPQFYFESDSKRGGTIVEAPEAADWETIFKRQRAIQGVCGKNQPDFSEQWMQQVSYSTEEKVRAIQKTKSNPTGLNSSREVNWLDSPDTTAEARLRRFDSEHLKTRKLHTKQKEAEVLIQWKASPSSVALFESSLENPGKDHSIFPWQIPGLLPEIQTQEKFHQFVTIPVAVLWPPICEKIRHQASAQIRQLADHLESLRSSGCNFLALCSYRPKCGCTTILLLCAREISSRGLKTLLIDGNFSHPSLAEAFQLSPTGGWESLLKEAVETCSETTLWSLEDNLDLLPLATGSAERAKNLFQDASFSNWTEVFRNNYDFVLIDSGSFSEQEKYSQLKRFGVDGVFLIIDDLEKSQNSLERLQRSLAQHEIAFLGVVENHVR